MYNDIVTKESEGSEWGECFYGQSELNGQSVSMGRVTGQSELTDWVD